MEPPMEARIARIEADVAHLRTDVADVKVANREIVRVRSGAHAAVDLHLIELCGPGDEIALT